ncbi:hypothetical protein Bca101_050832 [Brassica carinata]
MKLLFCYINQFSRYVFVSSPYVPPSLYTDPLIFVQTQTLATAQISTMATKPNGKSLSHPPLMKK